MEKQMDEKIIWREKRGINLNRPSKPDGIIS
jgi:hypothetical protein